MHAALKKIVPAEAFKAAGIDPTRRGETLTIDEFMALAKAMESSTGTAEGTGTEDLA